MCIRDRCLAYQSGSKTIDDIIDGLPETTNGKGDARNFESTGDFEAHRGCQQKVRKHHNHGHTQ